MLSIFLPVRSSVSTAPTKAKTILRRGLMLNLDQWSTIGLTRRRSMSRWCLRSQPRQGSSLVISSALISAWDLPRRASRLINLHKRSFFFSFNSLRSLDQKTCFSASTTKRRTALLSRRETVFVRRTVVESTQLIWPSEDTCPGSIMTGYTVPTTIPVSGHTIPSFFQEGTAY